MGHKSNTIMLALRGLTFVPLMIFASCCSDDCYENSNIIAPQIITAQYGNVEIVPFSSGQIYIGYNYYPYGSNVIIYNGATVVNRFFSVKRYDQFGNSIKFYWNENTPPPFGINPSPPFHMPVEGEVISLYMIVFNIKQGDIGCIFEEARSIESVLDFKVRVKDGEIVGEQKIIQKIFSVPAGKSGVFCFNFEYKGDGQYNFNIDFTAEGIVETDTLDNNYTISIDNLGLN